MKEMYKNNRAGGFNAMPDMEVALPVKRERESVFTK
jgi:hypothetical protein